MKILAIIIGLFSFTSAHAITFTITGKNGVQLLSKQNEITLPSTVGTATVSILEMYKVPYTGSDEAISSLYGQGQEMVMVSDAETKAYGWCFSIDGIEPNTMANETPVTKQDSKIEWYYGYAHYLNGAWIAQCKRD